jgi:hypothetical protein
MGVLRIDLPGHLSLKDLLSKARRRELAHLAADKTVLSVAIVMGGLILVLLAGTQFLEWYWLLLLSVASLGVGFYRLRRSTPSLYVLAQRIDQRLKLSDALSTALYFSDHPQEGRQAICDMQRQSAEAVAGEIDPKQAVPFIRPRYVLPVAGLAVAALALFGVRYMVTGTLDLQPSLLKMAYDSFFGAKPAEAENLPPRARFDPKTGNSGQDSPLLDADNPPEDLNSPENPKNDAAPGDDKTPGQNPADANDESLDKGKQDQSQGDQSGQGKNSPDQNQKEGDSSKNGDKQGGQDSKGGSSKDSSMMDKLRDALANMMNKMKSSSEGEKSAKNSQKGQSGDKQEPGEKGEQSKENQQSQADLNGDTQSEGDQKNSSDAQNSEKSAKNASQDAKNGIGSQDGEKAMREAEQLQAMGKISEIIGKRSANIAGEVMMEVGSSKQALKTAWTSQSATHSEAGSEIHRDEVPLEYQQFVEHYFEEVRKAAPATASAKPAGKADQTSKKAP